MGKRAKDKYIDLLFFMLVLKHKLKFEPSVAAAEDQQLLQLAAEALAASVSWSLQFQRNYSSSLPFVKQSLLWLK